MKNFALTPIVWSLLIAFAGIAFSAAGKDRVFQGEINSVPVEIKKKESFKFHCNNDAERQRIDVGVKAASPGKIDWRLNFNDSVNQHALSLNVKLEEVNKYDIDHDENIVITMDIDGEQRLTKNLGHKLPISRSAIYLRVLFNGKEISVMAGPGKLDYVGKIDYAGYIDDVEITSRYDITLCRHNSLHIPQAHIPRLFENEDDIISSLEEIADPRCGIYNFFDEEFDMKIAVKGGRYRLALLPAEEGGYNLIYIEGAVVQSDRWHTGMLKAYLQPTPFVGTYILFWTDSNCNIIDDMTPYATIEGVIITVVFPLQKAKFRFVKEI